MPLTSGQKAISLGVLFGVGVIVIILILVLSGGDEKTSSGGGGSGGEGGDGEGGSGSACVGNFVTPNCNISISDEIANRPDVSMETICGERFVRGTGTSYTQCQVSDSGDGCVESDKVCSVSGLPKCKVVQDSNGVNQLWLGIASPKSDASEADIHLRALGREGCRCPEEPDEGFKAAGVGSNSFSNWHSTKNMWKCNKDPPEDWSENEVGENDENQNLVSIPERDKCIGGLLDRCDKGVISGNYQRHSCAKRFVVNGTGYAQCKWNLSNSTCGIGESGSITTCYPERINPYGTPICAAGTADGTSGGGSWHTSGLGGANNGDQCAGKCCCPDGQTVRIHVDDATMWRCQ